MLKNLLAISLGFLLVIAFFWQNIFTPAVNITPTVGTNDFTDLNYPLRHFFVESVKKGGLPLWTSHISSGYPILAEGQIGALYPLNLFFALFDTQTSVNLTILSSYFFIFFFSFLYFRKIGITPFAAFFGATVVTFSGFAATQLMHFGMLVSFYLFLAQLWCLEGILRSDPHLPGDPGYLPASGGGSWEVKRVLLMGILLGFSILGGHPQIIMYGLLFLFLYWITFWFLRKKSIIQFFVFSFLFLVIGFGVGAGQILPQYELTKFSQRFAGLSDEDIFRFQFPVGRLVNFVLPFWGRDMSNTVQAFQMNGWPDDERYVYMGVIGFGLLVIGVMRLARLRQGFGGQGSLGRYVFIFLITIIISLLVSLGNQAPFGFALRIPPFSFFRLPFRILFLLNFTAGGLIALAVQSFVSRNNSKTVRYIVFGFLFCVLFLDLFYHDKKLHPAVDAKQWYAIPETVSFLKKNLKGQERVTTQYYYYPSAKIFLENSEAWNDPKTLIHLRNLLPAFNNLLYDIPLNIGAGNAAGLYVNHYRELEDEVFFKGLRYKGLSPLTVTDSFVFLNRLMGVRFALIAGNVQHEELTKVFHTDGNEKPDIFLYEFSDPLPRAFIVQKAEKASAKNIKDHLLKGDFNPLRTVFIEDPSPGRSLRLSTPSRWPDRPAKPWRSGDGLLEGEIGNAKITSYKDTEVMIQTSASSPGFLFLSDTYYPGWKAYVDPSTGSGQAETKIYRANYAFRAVWVPEGKHIVLFRYKPASFYYGVMITLGTLATSSLGIAALLFFDVSKKDRSLK